MTATQADEILLHVSWHILNSVQIFLLASASTEQKPSLLLKVLSKSRGSCPIQAAPSHRKAVPRIGHLVSAVTGELNRSSLVMLRQLLGSGNFHEY